MAARRNTIGTAIVFRSSGTEDITLSSSRLGIRRYSAPPNILVEELLEEVPSTVKSTRRRSKRPKNISTCLCSDRFNAKQKKPKRETQKKDGCAGKRSLIDQASKSEGAGMTVNGTECRPSRAAVVRILDDLKVILLDDSKFITVQKKLYDIPLGVNAAEVIEKYVAIARVGDSDGPSGMTVDVLFQGIIEYFDGLIGRQLLYEMERDQYELLMNNFVGVKMSTIYPPIYLLRLLVQMNKLLPFGNTSADVLEFCMECLHKFLNYLADNKSTFFAI